MLAKFLAALVARHAACWPPRAPTPWCSASTASPTGRRSMAATWPCSCSPACWCPSAPLTSSLTENQVVAATCSLGACLMLWFADSAAYMLPAPLDAVAINLSLIGHFTTFVSGSLFLSDAGLLPHPVSAGPVPHHACRDRSMSGGDVGNLAWFVVVIAALLLLFARGRRDFRWRAPAGGGGWRAAAWSWWPLVLVLLGQRRALPARRALRRDPLARLHACRPRLSG